MNTSDPDVLAYVRNGLNAGVLAFAITSMHETAQQAGGTNPNFYTRDNIDVAAIAPTMELIVSLPEPGVGGGIAAGVRDARPRCAALDSARACASQRGAARSRRSSPQTARGPDSRVRPRGGGTLRRRSLVARGGLGGFDRWRRCRARRRVRRARRRRFTRSRAPVRRARSRAALESRSRASSSATSAAIPSAWAASSSRRRTPRRTRARTPPRGSSSSPRTWRSSAATPCACAEPCASSSGSPSSVRSRRCSDAGRAGARALSRCRCHSPIPASGSASRACSCGSSSHSSRAARRIWQPIRRARAGGRASGSGRLRSARCPAMPRVPGTSAICAIACCSTTAARRGTRRPRPISSPRRAAGFGSAIASRRSRAWSTSRSEASGSSPLRRCSSTAASEPRAPARARDGAMRVAAWNLENFFNGDGVGGGFPTRGAATAAELERQRARIVETLAAIDADVYALVELENDGVGAAQRRARAGQSARGRHGGADRDRRRRCERAGASGDRRGPALPARSRARVGCARRARRARRSRASTPRATARALRRASCTPRRGADHDRGESLEVEGLAVRFRGRPRRGRRPGPLQSHAHARGGCARGVARPRSHARGRRARARRGRSERVSEEDPIEALSGAGLVDLLEAFAGPDPYSYVFDGAAGRLDHAFASAWLVRSTAGAGDLARARRRAAARRSRARVGSRSRDHRFVPRRRSRSDHRRARLAVGNAR